MFLKYLKWNLLELFEILVYYDLSQTYYYNSFLYGINAKFSKSFARFGWIFLNDSEIEQKSKVNPSFAFKQILVQGDLFSGRPIYLNIYQFGGNVPCFPLHFPQSMFFSFFELNL